VLNILGKLPSINVRKVVWTCAELDLPFERTDWGSGFRSTNTPEFLALNPNGLVPVIQDGDFVMWESHAIIRYLANRYDTQAGLYPDAAQARARVDQWMDWQATNLNQAWNYAFMGLVRESPQHQDPAAIKASCAAWVHHLRILEDRLARTGGYVAGEQFTLADIPIGLSVNRFLKTPFDKPDLPAIAAYDATLRQRSAYVEYAANGPT